MKMVKSIIAIAAALAVTVGYAGDSAPFRLDTTEGTRVARAEEVITYSTEWDNAGKVIVAVDGVTLKEAVAPALGEVTWNAGFAGKGDHTLTYTTYKNGVADKVETVTYKVTMVSVTFDAYGGSLGSVTHTKAVEADKTIGTLPTPTRTGYTFAGWWTTASGGTQISASTTVSGNVTYYAHWTVNQYTVTFDANGGNGGTTKTQNYGTSLTAPTVTRTGYTFNGWSPSVPSTIPAGNVTYTAQWTANRYTVTFNANGGTGTMPDQQMTYDEPVSVAYSAFTKPGSLFRGWATASGGAVAYREQASVMNLSAVADDVVTLYAVWQEKPASVLACEDAFEGAGTVSLDENDNVVVTLTNDVSGTVEIPDNVGTVTIDLNGHDMIGNGRLGEAALPGPAIRIVQGEGDGETTRLAIGDTSDGEKGQIAGDGESAGIEIAEDAAPGVRLDVEDDIPVLNGDGSEQDLRELSPVEYTLQAGKYFTKTLTELGYDVPTDGTAYEVKAYGLPAGLKLKSNPAVKNKKGKVVTKAKSEWWIEGVPTAAMDFFTNPPYLVITVGSQTTTEALPIEVLAQEVIDLNNESLWGEVSLGQSPTAAEPFYLPGVGAGWTVSGLPAGLKYATKKVTKKVGKKTVTVAEAYAVYGKTTKAGLFTITAKKKVGAFYETMKYRVLVTPMPVADTALFGDLPTNLVTMAYVPVAWDLTGENGRGGSPSRPQSEVNGAQSNVDGGPLGERALPAVAAVGGKVAKVGGLPTGLTFASADTYKDKKKTQVKQYGQTIIGTPTKPGTYVVTFTKNVKEKVKGKMKTVAKTAQILWKVVANDAKVELGFNKKGGVVESGVVGLKYGDLMAFTATSNATVTASGLPAGIKLVRLDDKSDENGGPLGERALPAGSAAYAFTGFTTKAGTYLVTVKATLNGKTVTQRVALVVEGLPVWAKGTFNGNVKCRMENGELGEELGGSRPVATNGLATITVSAAGKISGKFSENGTNWTISAECYTDGRARSPSGPQSQASGSQNNVDAGTRDACPYQAFVCSNVVAKYSWKVKSGKKTETKTLKREFTLTVSPVPVVPNVADVPIRGFATLVEAARSASGPYQSATEIEAWQNLWGSTYKAVGKKLFMTKSGKKTLAYKTFAYDVYTNDTGRVYFKDGDGNLWAGDGGPLGERALPGDTTQSGDGDKTGLTYFINLSLKVTAAGAVTATLTYDTGKTKTDKKTKKKVPVYYKPTCSTVVIPTSTPNADPFTGEVPLYFAPSAANGFGGFSTVIFMP